MVATGKIWSLSDLGVCCKKLLFQSCENLSPVKSSRQRNKLLGVCNFGVFWMDDEVSGKVVIVKSLSYILLLMVPEQMWDWHFCSYWCVCVFFCFVLFFVSPCLVLSVASWGSVSLAVSSSLWEWRFLYSYERYIYIYIFGVFWMDVFTMIFFLFWLILFFGVICRQKMQAYIEIKKFTL